MHIICVECEDGRDAVDTAREAAIETAKILVGEVMKEEEEK